MIQVIDRAARLVERLATAGGEGLALRELGLAVGLPAATCTRLLQELRRLGWVDQEGPRGRYRLGPRLPAIASVHAYRARLLAVAEPILASAHRRWGWRVALAVLRDHRRLVLCEQGHEPGDRIRPYVERADAYASASGRALVAALPWADRRRHVAAMGLPVGRQWPGVRTWVDLNSECARIRHDGWAENHPKPHRLVGVGVLVPDGEGGIAAIGIAVERADWNQRVIKEAVNLAGRIRAKI